MSQGRECWQLLPQKEKATIDINTPEPYPMPTAGLEIGRTLADMLEARKGPAVLRWALYEAAMLAAKATSPDHSYFSQVRARCGTSRAAFSVGRKILRRSYHVLRGLGDEALAPAS
jgi:hypothetical protein